MRSTGTHKKGTAVSPLVVVIVIIAAIVVVCGVGFYFLSPKPSPRPAGMTPDKSVIAGRVAQNKKWQAELSAAKREGRPPNRALEPTMSGQYGSPTSSPMGGPGQPALPMTRR
jgi:hypothetical protein